MRDSLKGIMFGVLVGLVAIAIGWPGLLFAFGCASTDSCSGERLPEMTSIPTLPAATMPPPKVGADAQAGVPKCHIAAVTLIGDWVTAGSSETEPFTFTDVKGTNCTANFKDDVQQLFITPNLWYAGAPACTTCHYADIKKATKGMDLSSYAGIMAGAERVDANGNEVKGKDILGGGNWEQAILHQRLYAPNGQTLTGVLPMPLGRPASVPADGPIISAGTPGEAASAPSKSGATPTAEISVSPTPEIARPSNPGGPGDAISLKGDAKAGAAVFTANCAACHGVNGKQGIANPGSDDGSVPPLNPIDETLVDADYKIFATNLDLFIQHGSVPAGTSPAISMPAWGDQGKLTQQQIADVIAFLISLNK